MNADKTEMTPGADICPHCKDGVLHWTMPCEPWSSGHWICGTCDSTYSQLPTTDELLKPTNLVVGEPTIGEKPECSALVGLVRELFDILDQEETSAGGRDFHPTTIQSCRIQHTMRLNEILPRMRELVQ